MFVEEQMNYINDNSSSNKEEIEILGEMQHFGIPTIFIYFSADF